VAGSISGVDAEGERRRGKEERRCVRRVETSVTRKRMRQQEARHRALNCNSSNALLFVWGSCIFFLYFV
jgi:hypothetical protein